MVRQIAVNNLSIMNKDNITPFVATHPGEMIKDELRETVSVTIPVNDRNLLKEIIIVIHFVLAKC